MNGKNADNSAEIEKISQEKRVGGSQERYTQEEIARVLLECRGLITETANKLGCSATTIHNYIAKYPALKETLAQARERNLDYAESRLFDLMEKGELGAIIFYLKTIGKARGFIERSERVNISIDVTLIQKFEQAAKQAGLSPGDVIEALIEQVQQNTPILPSGVSVQEDSEQNAK